MCVVEGKDRGQGTLRLEGLEDHVAEDPQRSPPTALDRSSLGWFEARS